MRFLSRFDDFESIVIDGSVVSSGLSTIYLKDAVNPILRIGNNTGDSFITYDGTELSISSDVDLRLTTPTDQDVFLITSSGNIVTTQGGGTFTIGGGLTLENFGAGYLKTDANGVVSIDTDIIEDTLDSVTDRGATTTNNISVGELSATGGIINLGTADTSSGHINAYENMTFNIDSDNDDTNRYFAWYTNGNAGGGSELMRLTEAGNVGIGTTIPTSKLQVQGSFKVSNQGVFESYIDVASTIFHRENIRVLNKAGTNWITWATRDTSGAESKIIFTNVGGNISQFTNDSGYLTAEADTLDSVTDRGATTTNSITVGGITSTGTQSIFFGDTGGSTPTIQRRIVLNGASDGSETLGIQYRGFGTQNTRLSVFLDPVNKQFIHDDTWSTGGGVDEYKWQRTGTDKFTLNTVNGNLIVHSGNVGIGTTSPAAKLDVTGGSIRLSTSGSGVFFGPSSAAQIIGVSGASSYLALGTVGAERMRITSAGNVGIGTTAPGEKLHVVGQAIIDGGVGVASSGTLHIRQKGDTVSDGIAITSSNAISHRIWKDAGGALNIGPSTIPSALVQTLDGNVGIGTTAPNDLLQVGGISGGNASISIAAGGTSSKTLYFRRSTTYDAYIQVDADEDLIIGYNSANLGDSLKIVSNATNVATFDSSGNLKLSAYTAGLLKTDASGNVSLDTTAYLPSSSYVAPAIEAGGGTPALATGVTAAEIRTLIDVDQAGTDNSTNVTLATVSGNYLTISGQEITAGTVPVSLGGTGATTAADARTNLGVDAAGTDNSTNVTLVTTSHDYLSITGQAITLDAINLNDINGGATAGLLATNASGVVSVNTTSYTPTSRSLTINGTAYDLSADRTWTISTITGNAGSATVLQTARTLTVGLTGKTFDGSANVAWTLAEIGAYAATNPAGYTTNTGTVTSVSGAGGYGGLTLTGTVTTSGSITLGGTPTGTWPIDVSGSSASTTGNAATATALQTARTINGTSFNGSANITTASWGTARNVTIGSSTKSVDGSANVSFSLAEIGAQAAGSYLTAESDTLQSVTTRGSTTTTVMSTNGGKLVFRDDSIENHVTNGNAAIVFNYYGYGTGFTQFRDSIFYNGKGSAVMFVDGSSSSVGIGTTNPSTRLTVQQYSDEFDSGITVRAASSTAPRLFLGVDHATSTVRVATDNHTLQLNAGSARPITFFTNSSERMTITSTGNVGIGTTSPSTKLHVVGTTYVQNGNLILTQGYGITWNNGDNYIKGISGYHLQFTTYDGASAQVEVMRLTGGTAASGGARVGIGTASPATKLHVVGTAETRLRVGSSNASSNVVLELRDENSPTGQGTVITYNNATGETYFNNALSTSTTDFHFQSGEYGTASDFFALSDAGGNSIVQLSTATGDAFITYEDAINELAIASDGDLRLTTPTDQDVFYISSGGNIDMTQAGGVVDMGGNLIVDGQVGIGVSPAEKLHVNGNILSKDATGNYREVRVVSQGAAGLYFGNESSPWDFYGGDNLWTEKGGSILTTLKSTGEFGIGTTAPQQLLHIKGATNAFMMLEADSDTGIAGCYYKSEDTDDTMNRTKGFFGWQGQTAYGNGYFTMWLDTVEDNGAVTSSEEKFRWERDGDFHADGDVIAYSTTTPSDARLKKDVTTIENASEKVAKLRGVEYTWNTGSREGKREIGLIAQEVEAVVPEVVTERQLPLMTGTTEEYKTVDYERLIALLIESNKEMQNRINELEKKVYGSPK